MIKKLFKFILNLMFYPLYILFKYISKLVKRLKFSIAFKISTSYVLLYFIIIVIVTLTSAIGYFVYEIKSYNTNIIEPIVSKVEYSFPDYKTMNNIIDDSSISVMNIFDEKLEQVYAYNDIIENFTSNIIVKIENIIKDRQNVISYSFIKDERIYHINTYYSIDNIIDSSLNIGILILASGIIGLIMFVPIVSRTSYNLIGPIKNMTEITRKITVNNINTRLDITGTQDELKELSKTFNEMMDRIEEGYRSQQQFVSDASHELRTPIAVIKGYVNMLDRWGKNDKEILEESIMAIKNEADNMQDLIEKLLFIARSDKHKLMYTKEDFKISEIIQEIGKETKMIDKSHNFNLKLVDDAITYADKNRIKQAIRIFVENAIKFTPENGDISLESYIDGKYYVIKVTDTGIGIAKKDLSKIFDRLYRAEESRSKDIGGHGLGLSIARIIVLDHKGKIKVKSKLNKGSEFIIMIPYLKKTI